MPNVPIPPNIHFTLNEIEMAQTLSIWFVIIVVVIVLSSYARLVSFRSFGSVMSMGLYVYIRSNGKAVNRNEMNLLHLMFAQSRFVVIIWAQIGHFVQCTNCFDLELCGFILASSCHFVYFL